MIQCLQFPYLGICTAKRYHQIFYPLKEFIERAYEKINSFTKLLKYFERKKIFSKNSYGKPIKNIDLAKLLLADKKKDYFVEAVKR